MFFQRPRYGKGKKKSISFVVCDLKSMEPWGNMPWHGKTDSTVDWKLPFWFDFGGMEAFPDDVMKLMSAPATWAETWGQLDNKATQKRLGLKLDAVESLAGDDDGLKLLFQDIAYGAQTLSRLLLA